MGSSVQQHVDHAVQTITNAPATSATLTGGVVGWLLGNQGTILFVLSAALIVCQLIAFGYRFLQWFKSRKNLKVDS